MGGLFDFFGGGEDGGGLLSSITSMFSGFSDPSLASAGIFSAATLASQLFGRDIDADKMDLARDQFEQSIINAEADRALSREELAARERMAGASAGATVRAAGISAGAQKQIAHSRNVLDLGQLRMGARDKWADRQIESQKGRPELIMTGRSAQANQARATGSDAQRAFESIMSGVQGALRR